MTQGVILLHDDAHPHTANVTEDKLAQFWWEILDHPHCSPDVSPCDFHIFGEMKKDLKKELKGKKFPSDTAVQGVVCVWVRSQQTAFYEQGIRHLASRQRWVLLTGMWISMSELCVHYVS